MRVRLSELRKIIAQTIEQTLNEEKKLPMDAKAQEAHYDSMPDLSAIADDSDVLFGDSDVAEGKEKESFMVPPETQKKLRHFFNAMGLSGHLPKQARFK